LEKAGAETFIASSAATARGMLGAVVQTNLALNDIDPRKYDAIVFVGGTGAKEYFNNTKAINIAKLAYSSGKIVAAICIAPSILANAGLLKGRNATAFPSEELNLRENGANYTGKPVEQDGKIITASGPSAAREFGKRIAQELGR